MPNNIVGLRYEPPHPKIETEKHLLEVFADLRNEFLRMNQEFRMFDSEGNPVCNFRQFLDIGINGGRVLLTGSGDLGGLVVRDARVEYDISSIKGVTAFWDVYRDGSCYSCHNIRREVIDIDESRYFCAIGVSPLIWRDCPKYSAKRTNPEGKAARTIAEIVQDVTA